ncbi:MAG: hypothetical protein CM15mP39_00200 [Synechococcus sp.]|nr:MAG: hypothetical protein CM15mP39_00200 [Synechococcus sp.]
MRASWQNTIYLIGDSINSKSLKILRRFQDVINKSCKSLFSNNNGPRIHFIWSVNRSTKNTAYDLLNYSIVPIAFNVAPVKAIRE